MSEADIDTLYREIGARVRQARRGCGMNQERLAELVGLTRASIANIESGVQRPPLHVLWRIAEAVDMKIYVLFPGASIQADEWVQRALAAEERVRELQQQIDDARRRAAALFR